MMVDFGCTMRGRAGGMMLIIIGLRMMLVGGHCNLITLDVFDEVSDMEPLRRMTKARARIGGERTMASECSVDWARFDYVVGPHA